MARAAPYPCPLCGHEATHWTPPWSNPLLPAHKRRKRMRRELSEGFLVEVAQRHAALRELGMPPTATLAQERGVAGTTVKYWLRKARANG